jgi:hypothetical protein
MRIWQRCSGLEKLSNRKIKDALHEAQSKGRCKQSLVFAL